MNNLDPADVDRPVVHQLRVVVTASDYDEAIRFYRDALGLPEQAAFSSPDGRVVILDAGRHFPGSGAGRRLPCSTRSPLRMLQ